MVASEYVRRGVAPVGFAPGEFELPNNIHKIRMNLNSQRPPLSPPPRATAWCPLTVTVGGWMRVWRGGGGDRGRSRTRSLLTYILATRGFVSTSNACHRLTVAQADF